MPEQYLLPHLSPVSENSLSHGPFEAGVTVDISVLEIKRYENFSWKKSFIK